MKIYRNEEYILRHKWLGCYHGGCYSSIHNWVDAKNIGDAVIFKGAYLQDSPYDYSLNWNIIKLDW